MLLLGNDIELGRESGLMWEVQRFVDVGLVSETTVRPAKIYTHRRFNRCARRNFVALTKDGNHGASIILVSAK